MWEPVLIWTVITLPLALLFFTMIQTERRSKHARKAAALASKCNCPICGKRAWRWTEKHWQRHERYADGGQSYYGYVFRCTACGAIVAISVEGITFPNAR